MHKQRSCRQLVKGILLTGTLMSLAISPSQAQFLDNVPKSISGYEEFINTPNTYFTPPDPRYAKQNQIIDRAKLLDRFYKIRDSRIHNIKAYNDGLKVMAEGYFEYLAMVPGSGIPLAMAKEKFYQEAEKAVDKNTNVHRKAFVENIKSTYREDIRLLLKNNSGLTFEESISEFSLLVANYRSNLTLEDYQILSPVVDQQIIAYIQENRAYFQQQFAAQKSGMQAIASASAAQLEQNFKARFEELKKSVIGYDKELLSKVRENAQALAAFGEQVNIRIGAVEKDIKKMSADIESNKLKIEENTKRIKKLEGDFAAVRQLEAENRRLISENSYKIDVITDVLSENVNTSGKMRLLDLQFRNDKANPEYLERRNVLENIHTVEKIQYGLEFGGELVTLAGNLGMSSQDLKKASQALAVGNVIANGAMAYFTGNPVAGLQAINGAISLFGGAKKSNPEFDAIMAQFALVNRKLDQINTKIDSVNSNINQLRKLNIDLFYENQKRFTDIDKQLKRIEQSLESITERIYYSAAGSIRSENLSGYREIWEKIDTARSLKELRSLYLNSPKLAKTAEIVHANTQDYGISQKPFLHFELYENNNHWEKENYKPVLELTRKINPALNFYKLENPLVYKSDYHNYMKLPDSSKNEVLFPRFGDNDKELERLIYPQSVIALSTLLNLFEPYYYYSVTGSFNIADDLSQIDPNVKNTGLKIQYMNLLKENRNAIIQTNLMSGATVLEYLYKHITEPGFSRTEKEGVYNILKGENAYLKLNLSTYILHSDIRQDFLMVKLDSILNSSDIDSCRVLLEDFNRNFDNAYYNLALVGSGKDFKVSLRIKPIKIDAQLEIKKDIYLPLASFSIIFENKLLYPEYMMHLVENESMLIDKVVCYDAIEKMNSSVEFKNLKLSRK